MAHAFRLPAAFRPDTLRPALTRSSGTSAALSLSPWQRRRWRPAVPPRRRPRRLAFRARQRSRGRGHSRPPHAGRHPHGLVPGRLRRRDRRQVRPRAFPRAPDVQGHREEPDGPVLADRRRPSAARRTPSPPTTTPATSSASPREHLKTLMEFEADRMTGLVLTEEVVKPELQVVLEEQNMRVANNPGARLGEQMEAALYLNHPYRPAGDRLAAGDRDAHPRRCAGVLQALLHAQQRDPGRRRRRDRRRGQDAGRGNLRQGRRASPRSGRAIRPQEPSAEAARTVTLADPRVTQPSVQRYLSGAVGAPRPRPARARRSKCSPTSSAAARTAGSTRRWWSRRASRSAPAPATSSTALDYTQLRRLRHAASPARRCRSSRRRSTPSSPTIIENGVTAEELERAKSRLIADADLCAGQPEHAGALVRRGARPPARPSSRCRPGPTASAPSRADAVRDAARRYLDKRRSVTGYLVKELHGARRNAREHAYCRRCPRLVRSAAAVLLVAADGFVAVARRPSPRDQDRARRHARRHRGLAGARPRGSADRDRFRLPRRRRRRIRRTSPASPTSPSSLLDEGAGELDAKTFQERMEDKAIELSFTRRPRLSSAARCARSRTTRTRRSSCCGWR